MPSGSGKFQEIRRKITKAPTPPKILLALDPGGTTGWAIFREGDYFISGQFKTTFIDLENVIVQAKPNVVLFEEYILYEHVRQAGSSLYTPRVIGAIEHICYQQRIPIAYQTASNIKQVQYNDDKLREWGFHQSGKPHANDATRHACRYLLRGTTVEPKLYQTNYYHDDVKPPVRRKSNSPQAKTTRKLTRGRK